jgi:hypothetical protein
VGDVAVRPGIVRPARIAVRAGSQARIAVRAGSQARAALFRLEPAGARAFPVQPAAFPVQPAAPGERVRYPGRLAARSARRTRGSRDAGGRGGGWPAGIALLAGAPDVAAAFVLAISFGFAAASGPLRAVVFVPGGRRAAARAAGPA